MNEETRTIKLYGKLGAKFGRTHKLVANSVKEAMTALCVLIPGFEKHILTSKERNEEYAIFIGKDNINETQLEWTGEGDIRIAPFITGSKKQGVIQTIIGVVLIVVGTYLYAFGGGVLVKFGVALVAGGVSQMLSPTPKGAKTRQDPDNQPSYAFGGPVNTTAAGNPVALLYGKREIGGAIVSAGIYASDYVPPPIVIPDFDFPVPWY